MRTAELRKMKRLMSYQVEKATRVKKIHSKTYRRIHKKERRVAEEKMLMVGLVSELLNFLLPSSSLMLPILSSLTLSPPPTHSHHQ